MSADGAAGLRRGLAAYARTHGAPPAVDEQGSGAGDTPASGPAPVPDGGAALARGAAAYRRRSRTGRTREQLAAPPAPPGPLDAA